jgi:cytidine deaminase
VDDDSLIAAAAGVLRPRLVKDRLFGDVAAAVESATGRIYAGVCVDTSSWGLCAERSAIAAMITAGEYEIRKIVAVWKNPETGDLHVLPPCGICREFMRSVDERNLKAAIVLSGSQSVMLEDLLPYHEWPEPLKTE